MMDLSTSPNMVNDVKIIIMTLIINFRVVLRMRENKSESPLSSSCQLIMTVCYYYELKCTVLGQGVLNPSLLNPSQ